MDAQTSVLMSLPMPALLAHNLRMQIGMINSLRATLGLLRDDGSHDPNAGRVYQGLVSQFQHSIGEVFGDYINGRGEVAQSIRTRYMASKVTGENEKETTMEEVEALIAQQLPTFNPELDPNIDGEWASRVRVMFGADFEGIWNLEELNKLLEAGKIPTMQELGLEKTGLFVLEDQDGITFGLRIFVDNGNRTSLLIASGEPHIQAATYVPVEDFWAPHNDGRMTDISQIPAILDTYFESIGLTEPMPAVAVQEVFADGLAAVADDQGLEQESEDSDVEIEGSGEDVDDTTASEPTEGKSE